LDRVHAHGKDAAGWLRPLLLGHGSDHDDMVAGGVVNWTAKHR